MPYTTINNLIQTTAATVADTDNILISSATTTNKMPFSELTKSLGGIASWKIISVAYAASTGDSLLVDTSAAGFAITLPNAPQIGDSVQILDASGTWATNNLSIISGTNIQGLPSPLLITLSSKHIIFVFNGTEWRF